MNNILTCIYCGHEYPEGTPAAKHELLTEHIKICESHPLREAERKINVLKAALVGLIGSDDPTELDGMEVVIRSSNAPQQDMVVAINAIDAIRMCNE